MYEVKDIVMPKLLKKEVLDIHATGNRILAITFNISANTNDWTKSSLIIDTVARNKPLPSASSKSKSKWKFWKKW